MTTPHRIIARAEAQVHDSLNNMASMTGKALELAMEALKTQDASRARSVVEEDNKQNELMRIVEHECLEILAKLEPKATDLREVVASMHIAAELERIGDHAKNICNIVLSMDPSDYSGPMDQIAAMADLCQTMLVQVMEAYQNMNAELAEATAAGENEIDELDEAARSSLMMHLMTHPDTSLRSTHLLWITYHLERISDRITNIAERVVFMVTAETPDLNT